MATIYGANTLSTGYDVANSLRFDDGSSDYLNRTPGSAGNRKTFTISLWIKRANLVDSRLISCYSANSDTGNFELDFNNDTFRYVAWDTNFRVTNRLFRDTSAWYHIVTAVDTTDSTADDRIKIYVNGVQETSFSSSSNPSQNFDTGFNQASTTRIGIASNSTNGPFDGYMAEVVFIDGQALAPTSFGEFDSNSPTIWKPKDVSGLTFGTNGFYLEFKQSGTSQNSSGLGADTSGNDNHFAVNNLTAVDQTTDTCTNNYTTMNPLQNYFGAQTYSEGNLKSVSPSGNAAAPSNTFGVSNGRWYAEAKLTNQSSDQSLIGISSNLANDTDYHLGKGATSYGMYSSNGNYYVNNGSAQSYGTSYTTNDIIGIYIDLTSNKLYMSKNGTVMNSGTGISITDPASTQLKAYFFSGMQWDNSGTCTWEWNFGAGTTYAISSSNADDNGYGNFEYSPNITGDGAAKSFYALNTKNLAEFG